MAFSFSANELWLFQKTCLNPKSPLFTELEDGLGIPPSSIVPIIPFRATVVFLATPDGYSPNDKDLAAHLGHPEEIRLLGSICDSV